AISKKTTKKSKQEQASYSQSETAASPAQGAAAVAQTTARVKDDLVAPPQPIPAAAAQPAASPSAPTESAAAAPAQEAKPTVEEPSGPIPSPLLSPAAWRNGDSFPAARAELAVLLASDPMKSDNLLKLARFLFAWRHADEALSTLADLKARDP